MSYGPRIFQIRPQSPSINEQKAQLRPCSQESIMIEKKMLMIECRIEILTLQASDLIITDNTGKETTKNSDRIKYYSEQLQQVEKVLNDMNENDYKEFIKLVMDENCIEKLEQFKLKVVDKSF